MGGNIGGVVMRWCDGCVMVAWRGEDSGVPWVVRWMVRWVPVYRGNMHAFPRHRSRYRRGQWSVTIQQPL